MFYKMIERSRDRWYASSDCPVMDLINYMVGQGHLRDAQIEAIKTYLFLRQYRTEKSAKYRRV